MAESETEPLLDFSLIQSAVKQFSESEEDATKAELLHKTFQDKEIQISENINLKLIGGDYVDLDSCKADLLDIESQLKTLQEELTQEYLSDITSTVLLNKRTSFFDPIYQTIKSFLRFIDKIEQKLTFHHKRYYLNESFKDVLSKLDKAKISSQELFELNLFVANCDHFVGVTDYKMLEQLEEVVEVLKLYSGTREVAHAIYSKALFLRNKMFFRKVHEHRGESGEHEIYIAKKNGENVRFVSEEYVAQPPLKPYEEWNRYLLNHYEIAEDWKRSISSKIEDRQVTSYSILELHRKIKYYKDIEKSSEGLKLIRLNLLERLTNAKEQNDKFNLYALKICLSYCYNNEFSLMCEKDQTRTKEEIESFYKEIDQCVETKPIKNYFIQAKYIKYKTQQISDHFEDKVELYNNLGACEELLEECTVLKRKYDEGLEWVRQNYNYVFQLPKEECSVIDKVGVSDLNVFVYSSVVLPINRKSLGLHLKDDLSKLIMFQASVENLRVTKTAHDEIKDLTVQLKESQAEFANKERKTLEILALFAAIVTFVAGTIPGFKFINNGIEAIYFTLSLGASMSLFALIFYMINRGHTSLKSLRVPIVLGVVGIIILWSFLYNSDYSAYVKTINKEQMPDIVSSDSLTHNCEVNISNELCCDEIIDSTATMKDTSSKK